MEFSKGFIVLESGECFEGRWLGGPDRGGEVVFNTSHSGYEEVATDPSYFGQVMVMTASQQGNYGVHPMDWESSQIHLQGFVSTEMQVTGRDQFWLSKLLESKVPVMDHLDTRKLVLRLRDLGTPWGSIVQAKNSDEAKAKAGPLMLEQKKLDPDWTWIVSRKKTETRAGEKSNGPRVAILDFGLKENTIRQLCKRSSEVAIFPGRASAEEILKWEPHGLMLSNGPGDPSEVQGAVKTIQSLLGKKPIFGICMGHQLLSLALGAKTYKLRFGHRGGNHPVRDAIQNQIYMTSQNHGYAVDPKTFTSEVKETHVNLYDKTNEGLECKSKLAFSVQFHPEACPGPQDAEGLFDFFVERLR